MYKISSRAYEIRQMKINFFILVALRIRLIDTNEIKPEERRERKIKPKWMHWFYFYRCDKFVICENPNWQRQKKTRANTAEVEHFENKINHLLEFLISPIFFPRGIDKKNRSLFSLAAIAAVATRKKQFCKTKNKLIRFLLSVFGQKKTRLNWSLLLPFISVLQM